MFMNGARYLVDILCENGVDVVFGYPGATVLSIYDELHKSRKQIRHIRTAHEQAAAHAADAYARVSGKTGVVIATSGPGATNLVTGIANAYMDSVPMVVITGNVDQHLIGTDSFQEVDIVGITMSVTKYNCVVHSMEELGQSLRNAFIIAQSGRKGPVLVDVPKDVLESYSSCAYIKRIESQSNCYCSSDGDSTFDIFSQEMDNAIEMIIESKRPVILVGGGVKAHRDSFVTDNIKKLAKMLDCNICSSLMGVDSIEYNYPGYMGFCGVSGKATANKAFDEADLIIAIGTRFSNRMINSKSESEVLHSGQTKVLHIDRDRAEINKVISSDCFLVGDAAQILPELIKRYRDRASIISETVSFVDVDADCERDEILCALSEKVGSEAYIITDVGNHQMWVARNYPFTKAGRFITSGGLGTMGFGLGAAIGTAIYAKDKPVVLIVGDGGFGMSCHELATIKAYNLPVLVIMVNNGKLGMVYDLQAQKCRKRFSQTTMKRRPLYCSLARCFGMNAYKAHCMEEFNNAVQQYMETRKATFVDLCMDIHGRNK